MLEHGISSVKAGKVEGVALSVLLDSVLGMVERHPRGILDIASLDEVREALITGKLDVWAAGSQSDLKLVAFTCQSMFVKKKMLHVLWVGGVEFNTYGPPLLNVAEKWAALQGIEEIVASGRAGWGRKLRMLGFRSPHYVELTKTVSYMHDDSGNLVRMN